MFYAAQAAEFGGEWNDAVSFYRKMLNIEDFNYSQLKGINELNHRKVNVVNCWPEMVEIKVGKVTNDAGNCAYMALMEATNYLKEDKIDAIITLLRPLGIKKLTRSGVLALYKELDESHLSQD